MKSLKEYIDPEFCFSSSENKLRQLFEMATVGYFNETKPNGKPKSPTFKVFVNSKEGPVPHLHIWDDKTDGQEFHTCIKLTEPAYFHHTGKEDVLTKKQIETFIEFLKSKDEVEPDKIIWDVVVTEWNRNNFRFKIDSKIPLPDYSQIFN